MSTEKILQSINLHIKIKKYLSFFAYFFIVSGVFIYAFYAINSPNKNFKIVFDYKKDPTQFKTEKTMTNPRMKFHYDGDKIYNITAKSASHEDEAEIVLQDVYVVADIGNITAGELKIDDDGNHLIFSKNPVLILKSNAK
jgi:hypothetical protein